MFRLSKYELRKNRNSLMVLLCGLAILQAAFMISIYIDKEDYIAVTTTLLILFGIICYTSVFVYAVTNYYREINSKTSYLIFMTPMSMIKIVISKMLTVLILGVILAGVLGLFAVADMQMLFAHYGEYSSMIDMINDVMLQFGINSGEVLSSILYGILIFMFSFYATVALVYLCITMAATLLQNSRFRIIASVVFFIAGVFIKSKLQDMIDSVYTYKAVSDASLAELLANAWPYTLLNLGVLIFCITVTTLMLDKKLSL